MSEMEVDDIVVPSTSKPASISTLTSAQKNKENMPW